jgi:dihydroxyacetone kinase-like protein
LVPAQEKYHQAISAGSAFHQALRQMADAAELGKESTRNLVAKIGRASRLGERSRGTLDPGATSCALLLGTFAKVLSGD